MLMWVFVLVYTKTVRWYGIKKLLKLIYSYNDDIALSRKSHANVLAVKAKDIQNLSCFLQRPFSAFTNSENYLNFFFEKLRSTMEREGHS